MKFASSDHLFQKFFRTTLSGALATSQEFMRGRLAALEKGGFLKSEKSFSESTRYFVTTKKGYQTLRQLKPNEVYGKPYYRIDQRVFVHDRCVLEARLELEAGSGVTNWFSDRRLRHVGLNV